MDALAVTNTPCANEGEQITRPTASGESGAANASRLPPSSAELLQWRLENGSRCNLCPLNGQRKVGSEGPMDAPLILIGEAPGAEEVKVGKPFVGRSGQLLFRALHIAGLEDEPDEKWWVWQRKRRVRSVLLVNTIMCQPPGNKIASPEGRKAVACCEDSAVALLQLLDGRPASNGQPPVAQPLGGTALNLVTNEDKISLYRGRVLDVQTSTLTPTDERRRERLKLVLRGKKPPEEWNTTHPIVVETFQVDLARVYSTAYVNHEKIIKCILAWNRRNLRPRKARAPRRVKRDS